MAQQLQQHPRLALGGRRSHLRGARAGPPGGGRGREGKEGPLPSPSRPEPHLMAASPPSTGPRRPGSGRRSGRPAGRRALVRQGRPGRGETPRQGKAPRPAAQRSLWRSPGLDWSHRSRTSSKTGLIHLGADVIPRAVWGAGGRNDIQTGFGGWRSRPASRRSGAFFQPPQFLLTTAPGFSLEECTNTLRAGKTSDFDT